MKNIFHPWQDTIPLLSGARFAQHATTGEEFESAQERAKPNPAWVMRPVRFMLIVLGLRTWI